MALDEPLPVLLHRREIEPAEPPAERDQLFIRQLLPAEQQHGMPEPGAVNAVERQVVNAPKINAVNLGAERRVRDDNFDMPVHAGRSRSIFGLPRFHGLPPICRPPPRAAKRCRSP